MPEIRRKKLSFPNTEDWEDFLDFSRWRVPVRSVLGKRLIDNSLLYSGNYLFVWLTITLLWGLIANWSILISLVLIAAGWKAAEMIYRNTRLVESRDGRIVNVKRPERDLSLPPSSKVGHPIVRNLVCRSSLTKTSLIQQTTRDGSHFARCLFCTSLE